MPPGSQVAKRFVSLKRRRASSAPCEDEVIRNSKRSRSHVEDHCTIKPLPTILDLRDDKTFDNEINKINKGKAKSVSFLTGCLTPSDGTVSNLSVIEELAVELKCGCCTELCYNPVVVNPCQHYFCGSCCVLWVQNGGTNCPACRGISTSVIPSRVVQAMINLLLRLDPSKARTENERLQADKVYKHGTSLILPTPRPKSPEPNLEAPNDNLARPCPTCLPGNPYNWQCPVPIQDPVANPDAAFDLDDGTPPGHAFCGNCDQLHNVAAPLTTKCDFCQVSFCGIEVQARCCALSLLSQEPQGMSDISNIILSGTIYERFNENTVEVDILLDYLRNSRISLRSVYHDIVTHFMKQPQGFTTLIDNGTFDDIHNVSGGEDPDPAAPRRRICRLCAAQVMIYGLKGWWIRERRKAKLTGAFVLRDDCSNGEMCNKQVEPSHSKEFNHIISDPYDLLGDTNVGHSASNLESAGGLSSGPSRDQSNLITLPRALPFSILMPFPIAPEGAEADDDPVSQPENNAAETPMQGTGNMNIPLSNGSTNKESNAIVEDGEVDVNDGPSGPMTATQRNFCDHPGGQSQHAFLESSASSYISSSSDAAGLPTSGDMTSMISSSFLSPIFPTST